MTMVDAPDRSQIAGPSAQAAMPRRRMRFALDLAQLVAVIVLVGVAGLTVWTLLPLTTGWSGHLIVSGSMTPSVQPGDVLITERLSSDQLQRGMIVVFTDPDEPGRTLAHRLQAVDADGRIRTAGDANPTADVTHATVDDVVGVTRLRVPYVGLPALWLQQGRFLHVAITAALVVAVTALAFRRPRPSVPVDGQMPASASEGLECARSSPSESG